MAKALARAVSSGDRQSSGPEVGSVPPSGQDHNSTSTCPIFRGAGSGRLLQLSSKFRSLSAPLSVRTQKHSNDQKDDAFESHLFEHFSQCCRAQRQAYLNYRRARNSRGSIVNGKRLGLAGLRPVSTATLLAIKPECLRGRLRRCARPTPERSAHRFRSPWELDILGWPGATRT